MVALAPEHEVENAKAEAKAKAQLAAHVGYKKPKVPKIKRKAAPQGFVAWNADTLDRLVASEPEPLVSRMRVTHAMVLGVIARGERTEGESVATMRTLLFDSHESRASQFAHARQALAIFRTLRQGGVVDVVAGPEGQQLLQLTVELQANFALNQPLSPFALAAIELLDPESSDYALDVVSVIEATLEDPRAIIRAQEQAARTEAIAAMKADGIEYERRMELLDEVTHPQPLKELLDEAFDVYSRAVPWAIDYELRPKLIVREMVERVFGFRELVSHYGLNRSEGTVLRYLSNAFRAIERTVPLQARTPQLSELIEWLGALVREVDSSLLDEWQSLESAATAGPHIAQATLQGES